ncbi:hypothetical protein [Bacillus sp. CECT 9360]|uniref:hypothetical protein n=1 Tax=Bacillus sp. CECT 9360 TaxID=2845821 RepID=UPI001E42C034|nr:hypothetical protein [Bacillus sp. CECT 9360]CAH0344147.1 hypothetical protein BCI9360_00378 [Bacillus sp. CECT 9360]
MKIYKIMLFIAKAVLIISAVIMPLTGDGFDIRGIGLAGILIAIYANNRRQKHNKVQ